MIKRNQNYFNRLHVVLDALIIAASYILSWGIKYLSDGDTMKSRIYVVALIFIVPGYLFLYYFFNVYSSKRVQTVIQEAGNIIKSNFAGLVLFILALYILHQIHFSARSRDRRRFQAVQIRRSGCIPASEDLR